MPKLSLYRPNKQNDYRFFDRTISEELRVGGTDLYIHKYLGPTNQGPSIDYTQPEYDSLNPLNIQDLLFLENRDRTYDPNIYRLRGHYNVQNLDFDLSQFGLFLNDSALVVETPEMKLLNANDCKIAGAALRSIIRRHGPFDFALRSHSSANDRVCYTLESGDYSFDDKDHYSRSFALFMEAVKPKYAVPFASNHCHLHKDVYGMNNLVNDPFKLECYLTENRLLQDVELKIMLSGDSWSSESGFDINPENRKYFENKEKYIAEYRHEVNDKLEAYYTLENKIKPNSRIIEMFQKQISSIPRILRSRLGDFSYKMVLFNDEGEHHYVVTPKNATVEECESSLDLGATVRVPIKIFTDSVVMNMFHHSSISKRNQYIFKTEQLLLEYEKFQDLLEYVELEVFPIRTKYIGNLLKAYVRRWREVIVYFRAYLLKRKGMPIYNVEEEILKRT